MHWKGSMLRDRGFFSAVDNLADKLKVEDAKVHKGYTLQVIVSNATDGAKDVNARRVR